MSPELKPFQSSRGGDRSVSVYCLKWSGLSASQGKCHRVLLDAKDWITEAMGGCQEATLGCQGVRNVQPGRAGVPECREGETETTGNVQGSLRKLLLLWNPGRSHDRLFGMIRKESYGNYREKVLSSRNEIGKTLRKLA